MICDNFIDNEFLSYLVVDYNEEDYIKEINRLKKLGIDEYNYYEVEGFTKYELIFRATRDGMTYNDFYNRCNKQGPTIVLIKNERGNIYFKKIKS